MNNIELVITELRKEPKSEGRDNVLDDFRGVCLHCCTEDTIQEMEEKLERLLKYYGYSELVELLHK